MSIVLTRYNAFIVDSKGSRWKYSCPSCFLNTEEIANARTVKCMHCGLVAGVLADPQQASSPFTGNAVKAASKDVWKIYNVDSTNVHIQCANCTYAQAVAISSAIQLANAHAYCHHCVQYMPIAYGAICTACMVHHRVLTVAEYICTDSNTNHTTKFHSSIPVQGKCNSHRCNVSCKKVQP